jgi:hypothetical protein
MLPDVQGMPQNKPLGPFEFRVPKLQNRMVTFYGKDRKCLESLDQFVIRIKTKEKGQRATGTIG